MTRKLLLIISTLFIIHLSIAQPPTSRFAYQKFSADTVKSTIDDWTKELSIKHPGFYRYNSKDDFNKYIDSIKSTIKDSLTEMETFLKFKLIITKIHCLHSGISLPSAYKDYLNLQPNLFPFQVYFNDNKAYVAKNYSATSSISAGDEIISINGQSIDKIVTQLLSLIPSDGYNLTMKYRALYLQFPSWYRSIDLSENFATVIKQNNIEKTYQIAGAKFNNIVQDGFLREPARTKQLEFKIENNIGFLTIHSFAQTDIQKAKQNFKEFIDQTFMELKTKEIQNLIVDVRDNTGGSDPYAAYFTSFFFDKPFRYWDRIEVTEAIAEEIKGVALKLYYRKPIQKDSVWLWQKAKHVHDFDFYEIQKPAQNNFGGKTYFLINGFCMSSCADVAAILSYNKKATFIGQETGGGYQGNTSGMIPESKVQPFDFTLTVPLQKYFNSVDTSKNIGRGTMPDYTVNRTINDVLKGDDKELQTAIDLIKKGSK
ncbi:MAG: S41 family peptidase [Bacteroidota bacterium]